MERPDRNPRHKYDEADLITLPSGHKVPREEFLKVGESDGSSRKRQHVHIDKLPAISGSIAGTSSRFLEEFRRIQQRDRAREEQFRREEVLQKDKVEFEARRDERKRELLEDAARKRDRRQKRKLGKSSCGLDLPSEVVQAIKADEVHVVPAKDFSDIQPAVTHPYALNRGAPATKIPATTDPVIIPTQPPIPHATGIKIIEEEE